MKIIKTLLSLLFLFPVVLYAQPDKPEVPTGTQIYRDLVYSTSNERELKLDLYLPESQEKLPLVIWVHGGAWRVGSKDNPRHALKLLQRGFAIASIQYRLSQEAKFPAQIIDCKAAVRWLRANAAKYSIDPDKIGAFGSSAGGHLVALMGTAGKKQEWEQGNNLDHSSSVQAVCDWYGPTDFLKMDEVPGNMIHLQEGSPESDLIGGDIRQFPEKVKQANPITYISADTPPFLIMHGTADKTVIPNQSQLLHQALQAAGRSSELVLLDNLGHGGAEWINQMEKVAAFFYNHLKE